MATQEANPVSAPGAEVVGNAFVEQYYRILHHSPELVHRFYQDSSSLSRPDAEGTMTTVSTMEVRILGYFSLYLCLCLYFHKIWISVKSLIGDRKFTCVNVPKTGQRKTYFG